MDPSNSREKEDSLGSLGSCGESSRAAESAPEKPNSGTEEARLREENDFLKKVIASLPGSFYVIDREGRFVYWNSFEENLIGLPADQIRGVNALSLIHPDDRQAVMERIGEAFKTGSGSTEARRANGGIELLYSAARMEIGGKAYLVGIGSDITQRKQAERALRNSEQRFRALFELSADAVMLLDRNGFFDCNGMAQEIFGCTCAGDIIGRHPADFSPPQQPDGSDSAVAANQHIEEAFTKQVLKFEWLHRRLNGELFPAEVWLRGISLGGKNILLATIRDITVRKQLELHAAQSQKIEAIGTLAAGIAHEINTPAQYVSDNINFLDNSEKDLLAMIAQYRELKAAAEGQGWAADVLRKINELESAGDLEYLLNEIPVALRQAQDGINQISTIARAMKAFAHPGRIEMQQIDINKAIENIAVVSRNEWKYVAVLELQLGTDMPLIPCHVCEMNQVILNLIVNASHAIEEKVRGTMNKGKIVIRTACDDDMVIEVEDDGIGISPEIRARIFEPFFTTKKVGKGSGQGLAIVRSVVEGKHRGRIELDSEAGKGTKFIIHLPLFQESDRHE